MYQSNKNAIKLYKSIGFVVKEKTETRFLMIYVIPEKNINTPTKIFNIMKDINYGWVDKDNNKYRDINELFTYKYILQSPNQLIRNKIGTCWDQVELERYYFQKTHLNFRSYFLAYYTNDDCPTHTFIIYQENNHFYWFEHSWEKYKGIHEYNELNVLLDDVKTKFVKDIPNTNINNIFVNEYSKPKFQISVADFFKHCEK